MAKVNMVYPFSRALCEDWPVHLGRHFYLCLCEKYPIIQAFKSSLSNFP